MAVVSSLGVLWAPVLLEQRGCTQRLVLELARVRVRESPEVSRLPVVKLALLAEEEQEEMNVRC